VRCRQAGAGADGDANERRVRGGFEACLGRTVLVKVEEKRRIVLAVGGREVVAKDGLVGGRVREEVGLVLPAADSGDSRGVRTLVLWRVVVY
jgi:hypothetical protein